MGRPKKIQFFFNLSEGNKTAFSFSYLNSDDVVCYETIYCNTYLSELPSVNNLNKQIKEFLHTECSINNFILDSINRL